MVDQEGGQEAVVAFVVKYSVTGPSNPPSVNLETRPSVETLPNRLHQECVTSLLLGATLDCHTDDLNMQLLMPCANHSRWWDTKQQCWVAVKHLNGSSKLVEPELQVLRHIADQAVPRTVATIDEERHGLNDIFVVMELVQGMTLQEYCCEFVKQGQLAAAEDRMLPVAVQLFDTLKALHERAHVAHMDLKSDNIMVRHDAVRPFDNMRLADFGYSRVCQAGEKDVTPKGLAPDYSAPEVLQSFFTNFKRSRYHSRQVDGPPADIYSAGVILFQMLTGCIPFPANRVVFPIEVPEHVPQHSRELWRRAAAVSTQQALWAEFPCLSENGELVQHPILDKVRSCSLTPDLAADFFTKVLTYEKQERPTAAQALQHPYLRQCAAEMQAYLESQANIAQDSPVPEEEVHAKPGKRQLFGRVGGAVRKQGGRLARTAGRVINCLPLFKGRRTSVSNDTASSSSVSSSDRASSSSLSSRGNSSSTKPPLSAYFFDWKHKVDQHSPRQAHKETSADGGEDEPESPRHQQPTGFLQMSGKEGRGDISMQALTSRQPPCTDQQAESDASGVPKVCARQAVMPVSQVDLTVPAEKEQACSALSAVPAPSMPGQPNFIQIPANSGTNEAQPLPVLSAGRYPLASPFSSAYVLLSQSTLQQHHWP
ncbi:hypothetical protein ABBQ38_013265 [Trebouxia sp. C0009 RCD-2024]